jgi:hypothetical protein
VRLRKARLPEQVLALPASRRAKELRTLLMEQFEAPALPGVSDQTLMRWLPRDSRDKAALEESRRKLALILRPAGAREGAEGARPTVRAPKASESSRSATRVEKQMKTRDPTDTSGDSVEHTGHVAAQPPTPRARASPPANRDDGSGDGAGTGSLRAVNGVWVVYAGLAVVLIAFVVAVIAYTAAGDVSTALAPVTGVVGAIVGAYFGLQVGAQGKEAAEQRADARLDRAEAARTAAERDAKLLAAVAPPDDAARVLNLDLRDHPE